jgi:ribosomal-protein-alanine N-acetyltransferase
MTTCSRCFTPSPEVRAVDSYQFEPAHLADAALLAAMSQQLVEGGLRPSWGCERIRTHIRHPESVVLRARCGAVTAGFAIMRYTDEIAHLNLLAVDPLHRRRGVGRRLVRWLEETALTAGSFIIGLELRSENAGARAFYAALGYRELARIPGYYQGVEAAIRMQRDVRDPFIQIRS